MLRPHILGEPILEGMKFNMKNINVTYPTLIELATTKRLLLQYTEDETSYWVFAIEENISWETVFPKGSEDATDFELHWKASSNQPLEIKASAVSPHRVVPTAQPLNTTEKWKGYHMEMAANELDKTILINFPIDVYLRGGSVFSGDCTCNDYITVDVVWTEYPATIIYPNLLENIHMMRGIQLPFVSAECMKFPTMLSLQITYHKEDDSKTRCVTAIANFFEPPQV
jgi:hypothetical protein